MADTYFDGGVAILSVWNPNATVPAYEPIACLTSNSFNQSWEILEARTKCSPGVVVKGKGAKNSEMPFDALFTNTAGKASWKTINTLANDPELAHVDLRLDGLDDITIYTKGIFSGLDLTMAEGEYTGFSGTLSTFDESEVDPHAAP